MMKGRRLGARRPHRVMSGNLALVAVAR